MLVVCPTGDDVYTLCRMWGFRNCTFQATQWEGARGQAREHGCDGLAFLEGANPESGETRWFYEAL